MLRLNRVRKEYKGFQLDCTLEVQEGCVTGLIGKNGAGKSTTIKLMLQMIQGDGGSVTLLGRDSRKCPALAREDIGVVLDEVGYPDCLTVKQVNRMMKGIYRNWQEEVFFGYIKKLELPENKEFKDFSRGMKMKLGIAVALSHNARLLILDEATSGLDPVVRDQVVDLFLDFAREEDHSILISSHIVSDLEKLCDYIAFLHKGRLLLCEEKDVLLEQFGILHCSREQLMELEPSAIKGKKESAYGVELIVRRDAVPEGFTLSPVGIEELFVFMVKEAR